MANPEITPKPVEHPALAKRRRMRATGVPGKTALPVLDVSLKNVTGTRVVQEGGRLRVVAEIGVKGFRRERRYERIPVTRLSSEDLDSGLARQEVEGHCPPGVPTAFIPRRAKRSHTLRP
jgi:hypothetical protein